MRAEKAVLSIIFAAITAMVLTYIFLEFYSPAGTARHGEGINPAQRIIDIVREKFHIQSPGMSDSDIKEKARKFIQ